MKEDETNINKKHIDKCTIATVGKPEVEAQWINLYFFLVSIAAFFCIWTIAVYEIEFVDLVAFIMLVCSVPVCHRLRLNIGIHMKLLNRHSRITSARQRVVMVAYQWTSVTHSHAGDLWHSNETSRISQYSNITYVRWADTNHPMGVCGICGFSFLFRTISTFWLEREWVCLIA